MQRNCIGGLRYYTGFCLLCSRCSMFPINLSKQPERRNTTASARLQKQSCLPVSCHSCFLKFISRVMSKIILASGSPRRKQLLEWAEVDFEICVQPTDESFPPHLTPME